MKTMPPCKKNGVVCKKHCFGCKKTCEAYAEWQSIHTEEKERERRKKMDEVRVNDFMLLQGERTRRCNQARSERDRRKGL